MSSTTPFHPALPLAERRSTTAAAFLAVCTAALVFRIGLLGLPPVIDEHFHLIAAQSLNQTGHPAILDGEYTRTLWFTRAVAWLYELTGRATFGTGRLVALVAGILIPGVLFLWLKARADWGAALVGAGLAVLWPQGIEESQLVRFYSWHSLTFLVGAIACFEAVERRGRERAAWALLGLAALAAALYLQITTAIGLAGILAWIGAMAVLPVVWRHRARWLLLAGLAAAGLAVLAALTLSGILAEAWGLYRWSAEWNVHRQNEVSYYHTYLRATYPVLWPLFPFAALLALGRQPRLAGYCLVLFGVILVGQSFGGMKAIRYLSFGMPFFFSVLAIALAGILPAAARAGMRAADEVNPTGWRWVSTGLVLATALFALLVNPFFRNSIEAIGGQPPSGRNDVDWSRIDDLVGEWQDVPFRLTIREFQTIAELGDYDVLFSPVQLADAPDQAEFWVDPRTGRPVVGGIETVAAILRCEPEGLILGEERWWQGIGTELMPLFDAAGREVEIRDDRRLFALRWSGESSDPASCAALPL